ncbi:MAG: hypothetical protein ACNS64_15335 [Candidatus Halalkalibacterium sp. M3_1C_030]|jgi:uncharacterized cupredoxin-like copper-binding protein
MFSATFTTSLIILFLVLNIFSLQAPDLNVKSVKKANAQSFQPVEINLSMDEYEFRPETIRFISGEEVVLKVTNEGKETHQFVAGNFVNAERTRFTQYLFKDIEVKKSVGKEKLKPLTPKEKQRNTIIELKTGQSGRLVFSIPFSKAGLWWIACFGRTESETETHYQKGMKGVMLVEPQK